MPQRSSASFNTAVSKVPGAIQTDRRKCRSRSFDETPVFTRMEASIKDARRLFSAKGCNATQCYVAALTHAEGTLQLCKLPRSSKWHSSSMFVSTAFERMPDTYASFSASKHLAKFLCVIRMQPEIVLLNHEARMVPTVLSCTQIPRWHLRLYPMLIPIHVPVY